MIAIKEQIMNNLEFLNEQQLLELADFASFLKVRSKIQKFSKNKIKLFHEFTIEDKNLAEFGMADYNSSLLEEDRL